MEKRFPFQTDRGADLGRSRLVSDKNGTHQRESIQLINVETMPYPYSKITFQGIVSVLVQHFLKFSIN